MTAEPAPCKGGEFANSQASAHQPRPWRGVNPRVPALSTCSVPLLQATGVTAVSVCALDVCQLARAALLSAHSMPTSQEALVPWQLADV